jgi:hypothetical protein
MGKNRYPRLVMTPLRLFVREACMSEPQLRSAAARDEFHGYHGFGSLRTGWTGEPGEFDEPVTLKPEESSVVWMALARMVRFEEERDVDLSFINTVPGAANQRSNCSVQALNSTCGDALIRRSTVH